MTFGLIARSACAASLALLLLASPGLGQTAPPPEQIESTSKVTPDIVGAGGEYTYGFDFDLPEFRGLVPNLRLRYNSADISRGGTDNIVAFGWRLGGLSVISRESVGGGVPVFDDGQDIYRLDGDELMACDDVGATNKWVRKYPLRYLTTVASASCGAGGNFSTRVESYNKVTFDDVANEWLVVRPDGRRYRYQAVGVLAGDTSTAGDTYQMGHQSRWVLTEITDTQQDAGGNYTNKVTISWFVRPSTFGFAERPDEISYAGYKARFFYQYTVQPVARFGTGTATLGAQNYRLNAVAVYDGATSIRAYGLVRSASAMTGTDLLQKIESYGWDFSFSSNSSGTGAATYLSGGTKQPDVTFEYSADTYALTEKTYAGKEFHRFNMDLDWGLDGAKDLALFGRVLTYSYSCGRDGDNTCTNSYHTLASARYSFDPSQNLSVETTNFGK